MFRNILNLSVAVVAVFAMSSSTFANESFTDVMKNAQSKQNVVTQLRARIAKHEKMSLSEIKEDLTVGLENNRKWANDHHQMTATLDSFLASQLEVIQAADDKDLLLTQEKMGLQDLVTSTNYMFFFSQAFMNYIDALQAPTKYAVAPAATLLLLATGSLDMATLLFTFIASAVTGF